MKLIGQVRSVERALGNQSQAAAGTVEKRNFKIDVRPASKPDGYYGYGNMQFILHGRELQDCGLDLGTAVEMYLVPEGAEKPGFAELDDARRSLYEAEQKIGALERAAEQEKRRQARVESDRFGAGERMQALQRENVRLTVELMTLRGAVQDFSPTPTLLEQSQAGLTTRGETA